MRRAWIEIAVRHGRHRGLWSPSMRRAWIEIAEPPGNHTDRRGRPLCGGRGLKFRVEFIFVLEDWSPSMRRAWIEILLFAYLPM